ncbi:MAG: hypothetical protein EHM58_01240 [Ignavibacteriae bacterium]|nr:MAG: hypothetical protein EHM58_01240 [Ignavibacteriota bacterium]
MDLKKASKYLSDFITIGNNIFKKSKINFVGIEHDSDNKVSIKIEKGIGKSINVKFDTLEKAEQELRRIEEELDKNSFGKEISKANLYEMPKEYLERIRDATSDEEILQVFRDYDNYRVYISSMDSKKN